MKLTSITSLLALVVLKSYAQTTLFQQDFSAGGAPANYVDAANPGTARFTDISATSGSNGSTSMGIVNNALEFFRPAGSSGQGRVVRALDFAPVPTSLYIQFSFDASEDIINGLSASATSVAVFYVGTNGSANSFANNGSSPDLVETFAKLGFNYVKVGSNIQWQLRNITSGNNSSNFSGKHLITWVLNKTGGGITYVKPNGVSGLETLAANKWDAWIDGTRVFDEINAVNASVDLRRFKFIFDGGIGYIRLDDFLIRDINGVLPVISSSFKAVSSESTVDLSWQSSDRLPARFSIERSSNAKEFVTIGSTEAIRPTAGQRTYKFTDYLPITGTNYYRIRQTDADGSESVSKIIAAEVLINEPDFTILDNPGVGTLITLYVKNIADASFQLTTLTGKTITCHQRKMPDGRVVLLPQHPLPSGVYLVTASTGAIRLTRRLQVR